MFVKIRLIVICFGEAGMMKIFSNTKILLIISHWKIFMNNFKKGLVK